MRWAAILTMISVSAAARGDEARALLDELVAIDTSNPPGNEAAAARAAAARLTAAGVKSELVEFAPGRASLVARLRGDGKQRPLLLLAHLDVVGAAGQPWTVPPFAVTEKDGWLYGRGVLDDKGWAAVAMAVFLERARAHTPAHRDLVLALTGDEESGGAGVRWLIAHRKDLIGDVEIGLNEGGSLKLDEHGKVAQVTYQPAEKTYQNFELKAHGLGGHSSVPNDQNAIYQLARALERVAAYKFPPRLTPTVRASLRAAAVSQPAERAAAMRTLADSPAAAPPPADALAVVDRYPLARASIRTTCVATQLTGGTRENALPVTASATVNCRMMAADPAADTQRALVAAIADPGIEVRPFGDMGWGPEIAVEGVVPAAIRKVARERFGSGVVVTPAVGNGATDSRFLRAVGVQSYGIGVMAKPEELIRAPHGPDEGAPAASLAGGVEWLRALVHALVD